MRSTFYLGLNLLLLFALLSPEKAFSQCNINTTICSTSGNTAGPFTFQTPSNNPSSCLDFWNGTNANYGYIVLYITQSGTLDLLIQGDYSGFSCLDVAIFDITNQNDPCSSLSTATEISCNYVAPCSGCAEFGSANLGCPAVVDAGTVNAGDVLMILVEDWSDVQNSFTLTLGSNPGSAQTGLPDPTIIPSTFGPFCASDGLSQIQAENMGGTWSGPGMSSTGIFDPQAAGPGAHTINYSIGSAPCIATSSAVIIVGAATIDDMTIGSCVNDVYNVTGNITVLQPPTTGDLIVESCDGQQVTIASAPFIETSYPFDITGLTANGSPCNIQAYFTGSPCFDVLNYTAPTCPPLCDITVLTATPTGCQAGNTYTIAGSVSFTDPPTTGQLIVQDCSGATQTFNPPFTSPINYSINSLIPNGQACNVTAYFTAEATCTSTTNYTAPSIPIVNASADVTICMGESTTISASGATTYSWDNGAGTAANATVSPNTSTTYTVTGTTNGCIATDQTIVNITPKVTPTFTQIAAFCEGTTAPTLPTTSTNGITGTWSPATVSNTAIGNTTYTFTPATGQCAAQQTMVINVTPNPTIAVAVINPTTCGGNGTINFTFTNVADGTYTIGSFSGVVVTSGTASVTAPAGTYNGLSITNQNGCISNSESATLSDPDAPSVNSGPDLEVCAGETATLIADNPDGATITWDNGVTDGVAFVPPVGTTT
ncbi:MAG TPA: hypothetical protein VL021_06315, partial [Brumimicrobium sp.]|nr:hypothetical protein [Brumimicrobium sp.]